MFSRSQGPSQQVWPASSTSGREVREFETPVERFNAWVASIGWSFGAALVFVGVWTVMMAAMMLPAVAPMILTFASAQARRDRVAAVPTWIFIAGYLFVWSAVGVVPSMCSSRSVPTRRNTLPQQVAPHGGRLCSGRRWSGLGFINSARSNGFACITVARRWRLWRCIGATVRLRRCVWGFPTARTVSGAAGRCSRYSSLRES